MSLPTIADLYSGNIKQAQQLEQFAILMNCSPEPSWVKKHPFGGFNYLPIDKVEFLLKSIFKQFRIEVLSTSEMFNGVTCTVRLHYKNPVTDEWDYHDGVGAESLQTKKGCSAADFASINTNALAMALPIARASAIKNAAMTFGNLFGANLNRRDTLGYQGEASILATIKKTLTPADSKLWENAKNAYRRDGNLNKVLERCDISAQHADQLRLEVETDDSHALS
jgi:hypothetical protein